MKFSRVFLASIALVLGVPAGASACSEEPGGQFVEIQYEPDAGHGKIGRKFRVDCRVTGDRPPDSKYFIDTDAGGSLPRGLKIDPDTGIISGTPLENAFYPVYVGLEPRPFSYVEGELYLQIRDDEPDDDCGRKRGFAARRGKLTECQREALGFPAVLARRHPQGIVLRHYGAPAGWGLVIVGGRKGANLPSPKSGKRLYGVKQRRRKIRRQVGGVVAPTSIKVVRMFWVRKGEKPLKTPVLPVRPATR